MLVGFGYVRIDEVPDENGAALKEAHPEKIPAPQWVGDIAIDPFNPGHAMSGTGGGIWSSEDVTAADADRPTRWVFRNQNLEETAVLDTVSQPEARPLLPERAWSQSRGKRKCVAVGIGGRHRDLRTERPPGA